MAGFEDERTIPHERRAIHRPRLIAALDRSAAPTVLVVGAAGYGKTTLLRQWIPRDAAVWYRATLADSDVAALARHLGAALGGTSSMAVRHVEEVLKVVQHPARSPDDIGRALLDSRSRTNKPPRVVIDDYEKIAVSPSAERIVEVVHESNLFELVIASRVRPSWATARRFIYGEIFELDADALAFTDQEVEQVLGSVAATPEIFAQARGWPAVIGLIASVQAVPRQPRTEVPSVLYSFFADEVFSSTENPVRGTLLDLALRRDRAETVFGSGSRTSPLAGAVATGLAQVDEGTITLHPLARSFLLEKIRSDPTECPRVEAAIREALDEKSWDDAFSLIQSFRSRGAVERLVTESFRDLLDGGRIATLEAFARSAAEDFHLQLSIVELVEAEVAFRDGRTDVAQALAESAAAQLAREHPLAAEARILAGRAALLLYDFAAALRLFGDAAEVSTNRRDTIAALWGQFQAWSFLERPEARDVAEEIAAKAVTPDERVRAAMAGLQLGRTQGLRNVRQHAAANALLRRVADPRTRTSFGNICGYVRVLQARYEEAATILAAALHDAAKFELSFARPHIMSTQAAAVLGLRDFTAADSLLREVERYAQDTDDLHNQLNARVLRARLLLAQHRATEALTPVSADWSYSDKLMYGEYLATRALVLAVIGERADALADAGAAAQTTAAVEARVTVRAAEAVAALGTLEADDTAARLFAIGVKLDVWDPIVTAVRAAPDLLQTLARNAKTHAKLARVLRRSGDTALARRCGLGVEVAYGRRDLLSKREHEVLDLLRQGLTNREIAGTLYIAESTAKVHVRHIFDKLNVRSRAEAVARYAETAGANERTGVTEISRTSS